MAMTYSQQLADPRWQRRRLERLEVAGFSCDNCGSDKEQLHVHHRQYFKGRKAWEYSNDELQVLCKPCHEAHHRIETAVKEAIARTCLGESLVTGVTAGFLDAAMDLDLDTADLGEHLCWDGIFSGHMAYIFFSSHRDLKAQICRILLEADQPRNPVEQNTLEHYAGISNA